MFNIYFLSFLYIVCIPWGKVEIMEINHKQNYIYKIITRKYWNDKWHDEEEEEVIKNIYKKVTEEKL